MSPPYKLRPKKAKKLSAMAELFKSAIIRTAKFWKSSCLTYTRIIAGVDVERAYQSDVLHTVPLPEAIFNKALKELENAKIINTLDENLPFIERRYELNEEFIDFALEPEHKHCCEHDEVAVER
ncbi:MAG: hypothetical protein WC471_03545 [Candidatus Woesearchaeota archaeon]